MGEAVGVKGEEEECEKLREMLEWMKAEAGRSVREEGEERRRRIREDWENREMLEIVEEGKRVRVVR